MLGSLPILPLPEPPADGDLGPLPPSQVSKQEQEEKPSTEEQSKANSAPVSVAIHTRTIGIIHPPPDIRNIVDNQFVAKNGPEFEKMIIANNANNARFNFLSSGDPYRAYYQHQLSEFRARNQSSTQQPPSEPADSDASESVPSASAPDVNESAAKPDPAALFKPPIRKALEPPEAEQYTVRLPEGITGEELDIIKLTAQFVARNEKSFLTGLTSREIKNPQFHFLKPTLYVYIFYPTDAYSKVLMPPKGLTENVTLRRLVYVPCVFLIVS